MKQYRKVVSLLLCIGIVCAFLTACTAQEEQSSEQDPDNPAIARVNGKEILLSEYKEQEAFVVDFLGEDVSEEVKMCIRDSKTPCMNQRNLSLRKHSLPLRAGLWFYKKCSLFFALLVRNSAGGFAGGLARSLAFAASTGFYSVF